MVAGRQSRDTYLDILRGIAMFTIAMNHVLLLARPLGYAGPGIPTPSGMGFSSAAEIFVALSGYMAGFIYASRPHYPVVLLGRAWKLYALNCAALLLLVPLILFGPDALLQQGRFLVWESDTTGAILGFLALLQAPSLLDVLQLYVVLLLLSVPAIWLLRRNSLYLLLLSFLIYVASQLVILSGMIVPGEIDFWLPAWQFLFFGAMAAGFHRLHPLLFRYASSHALWIVPVAIFLALSAAYSKLDTVLGLPVLGGIRHTLEPLRIIHAAALVSLYVFLITRTRRWHATSPFRILSTVGSQTLVAYLCSVVVTYYAVALLVGSLPSATGYLAATAVVVGAVVMSALLADQWRTHHPRVRQPTLGTRPPKESASLQPRI